MPLRLSDQPRDPEAEATLQESDGEGMVGSSVTGGGWAGGFTLSHWFHETKFNCEGESTGG